MFPTTITLHNVTDLQKVMSVLYPTTAAVEIKDTCPDTKTAKPKAEKVEKAKAAPVTLTEQQQAAMDDTAGLGNDAPAVTSQPTAEPVAVPVKKVEYSELQAAVLALHKMDATAAKPIAEAMGFANFKAMPEDRWAKALAIVIAKTADVKGGV